MNVSRISKNNKGKEAQLHLNWSLKAQNLIVQSLKNYKLTHNLQLHNNLMKVLGFTLEIYP
jgi:hypothetical protein